MYTISFDPDGRILHIRTWGFWDVASVAVFTAEVLAKAAAAGARYGRIAVLADMRDAAVQSMDVTDGVESLLAQALRLDLGPIAGVVGSRLGKIQSDRVLKPPRCRNFLDIDEARAWIDAERTAPRKVA